MEAYQYRVIDEHRELNIKLSALCKFKETVLWDRLEPIDRQLLQSQMRAMRVYSEILDMRISQFK